MYERRRYIVCIDAYIPCMPHFECLRNTSKYEIVCIEAIAPSRRSIYSTRYCGYNSTRVVY